MDIITRIRCFSLRLYWFGVLRKHSTTSASVGLGGRRSMGLQAGSLSGLRGSWSWSLSLSWITYFFGIVDGLRTINDGIFCL